MSTSSLAHTSARGAGMTSEEKFVIFASSTGTIFEWYDFYLYAVLAPFFAALFFPPGNDTAALLSAFATYAAGFLVRPFGALLFGRIGDLVGRKYTFLVTILVMGASTFAVGLLPTYASIGWLAPILLVSLRLLQGLALGGEYGGAATYVAEHARPNDRGYATSWIQTTATLGLFMALGVILLCRTTMDAKAFAEWGWRIPFLISCVLLLVLGLGPAEAEREPDLPEDEGRRQRLEVASDRQLHALSEQQIRAARVARRHRRPGRGVVHGAILRPVLPHHHAEARLRDRVYPDRHLAVAGHAVLHRVRMAVRPDRPPEDHPGRMSDRCGHLLPAIRCLDASRQSRSRGIPGEAADLGRRRYLDLPVPHLRGSVVEILRLRPRQGLRDQARRVVQDRASAGRLPSRC